MLWQQGITWCNDKGRPASAVRNCVQYGFILHRGVSQNRMLTLSWGVLQHKTLVLHNANSQNRMLTCKVIMTLLYVESMALGGRLSLLVAHQGKAEPSDIASQRCAPQGLSCSKGLQVGHKREHKNKQTNKDYNCSKIPSMSKISSKQPQCHLMNVNSYETKIGLNLRIHLIQTTQLETKITILYFSCHYNQR